MGGSKTAIFTQVVHFYSDGVDHITIGDNTKRSIANSPPQLVSCVFR